MKVEVFDDVKGSIAHLLAGGATYFCAAMFVVFMLYEYIEHLYLAGKEKQANYMGDILEYSVGMMAMTMFVSVLGCVVGALAFIMFVLGLAYCIKKWEEVRRYE